MKLQTNPNAWSCLLTAAAMVLDVDQMRMRAYIGHDGSEIKYPDLKDPHGRRGFHMQEIIDVAMQYGFSVTPIEVRPCSTNQQGRVFEINLEISRFHNYLASTIGIITGFVNNIGHAIAWDGKECYDPRGRICDLDDLRMDIDCYWLFQEIKSFSV